MVNERITGLQIRKFELLINHDKVEERVKDVKNSAVGWFPLLIFDMYDM